jgi:dipeptidyl aminopeptidase/acylaminoacyl peptidase
MSFRNSLFCALLLACASSGAVAAAATGAPFTIDDLVRLKRLSDPQLSPDGRYVVYVLRETDMDANKGRTDLWILDLKAKDGQPRRLTENSANDSSPRWAPDSRTIYFLSTRSGSSQVWRLSLDGGESAQVTSYPLDVGSLKVSPSGDHLAISMEILPNCEELSCTKNALDEHEKNKATGRIFDRLFIRHWDTWSNGTRSHLFTARILGDGNADTPVDVSRGLDGDVPSKPFGGDEDYVFSPDGRTLVFSLRVAGRSEPWSTNFDLFEVPVNGTAPPRDLTASNPAWDAQPIFLKNGDLVWLAQDRPGFEADRYHIMIRSARNGNVRPLTSAWDRSVSKLGATPNGRRVLATADDVGQAALFSIDPSSGTPTKLVSTGEVEDFVATETSVIFTLAGIGAPSDLFMIPVTGGDARRLTAVNEDVLGARQMSEYEQFSFKGWNDETVYGYVVKPYGFDPGKRFPIAFVVHGGP